MSDDNPDDGGDDTSLAEQNAAQITELTQAVETLTDAVTDDEEKTVTIEAGGEVHDVTESEVKAWFDDDNPNDGGEKDLETKVDELHGRLDQITQQSGVGSDQLNGRASTNGSGDGDASGLTALGEALS
jgi:hypothetical protein